MLKVSPMAMGHSDYTTFLVPTRKCSSQHMTVCDDDLQLAITNTLHNFFKELSWKVHIPHNRSLVNKIANFL